MEELKKALRETVDDNQFIPIALTRRQQLFLAYPAREILFGGAAGGGKSVSLLAAALQYVSVPDYAALLLRRTFADLWLPDALIPLSHQWLSSTDAKWDGQKNQWTFPSGATLTFGYLDTEIDKYRYQGAAFQFIGFDELTQFTETQYLYLFSRCRRKEGLNVPIRVRAASNPGGTGHEWVKKRFIDKKTSHAVGRAFILSRLEDNPHLDQSAYDTSLRELDPITRAQLRHGDWDIVANGVFKKSWFRRYRTEGDFHRLINGTNDKLVKISDCTRLLVVDVAGTEKLKPGSDPDYTVIQVWDLTPDYDLVLVDQWRDRRETPEVEDEIVRQSRAHECPAYVEEAGMGLGVIQTVRRRGVAVRSLKPKGKTKLQRSHFAQIRMEAGTIYFPVSTPWLDSFESEVLTFPPPPNSGHDDQVDDLSYAAQIAQQHGGPVPDVGDTSLSSVAYEIENADIELAMRNADYDPELMWQGDE